MSQRVHPQEGDANQQSREDLVRQRDRYAEMTRHANERQAVMQAALHTADQALGEVLTFIHGVGFSAPEVVAQNLPRIEQIVTAAKDISSGALTAALG